MMRQDVKPPVKLKSLEIDGTDDPKDRHPHYRQRREKRHPLVTVVIIFLLTLLAAGGVAGYFFLLHTSANVDTTSSNTSSAGTSGKMTAKTLVDKAQGVIKGEVKLTTQDTDGGYYNVFSAPPFKPNGFTFSVRPSIDYGFGSYGTKTIVAADVTLIQGVLTVSGLKGNVIDPGSDVGSFYELYESDTIICSLSDQKPYSEPSSSTKYDTILGCADKSDYLANAATLRPYFIVYASQSQFSTTHTLITGPNITASKTAGYSTATVAISSSEYSSVGGFAGLFYVTPNKTLHYFTGTQSVLPCSKYSTDDLKKAYVGEQCYDETAKGYTTVRL
jgi:hypothetical protein